MKVYGGFIKRDGSRTPLMTAEEIKAGKYTEYGISEEEYQAMWIRHDLTALRLFLPDTEVTYVGDNKYVNNQKEVL